MSMRSRVAEVVGLIACGLTGWALYQVALTTDCGGTTGVDCPPDSVPYLLTGGLLVAIIATVAGGGRRVFLGLFLAIAAGLGIGALRVDSEERITMLVVAGSFAAVLLLPVVMLPFALRKRQRAKRLLTEGQTAIATVRAVTDTGVTINKDPRVTMTLDIAPTDGSANFEGTKTAVVSRLKLPYVGQRYPAWFDREDRTTFMLGTEVTPDASPQVKQLFALAAADDPRASAALQAATGPVDPVNPADPLDRLAKLHELRQAGALTHTEFEAQKAKLLGTD